MLDFFFFKNMLLCKYKQSQVVNKKSDQKTVVLIAISFLYQSAIFRGKFYLWFCHDHKHSNVIKIVRD